MEQFNKYRQCCIVNKTLGATYTIIHIHGEAIHIQMVKPYIIDELAISV